MSVLLLRLVGPMQSWGVQSRFTMRDTGLEPSKSGIIGLLCAAQGRERWKPLNDLSSLRMAVRVDREGSLERDFHTAGGAHRLGDPYGVPTADGSSSRAVVSTRYYLADARFLVGLEGANVALLQELHNALRNPVWPLCLGRKAFVPAEPVWLRDGLRVGENLLEVLTSYPWLTEYRAEGILARVVLEDDNGPEPRNDVPVSFARRDFGTRRVRMERLAITPREA